MTIYPLYPWESVWECLALHRAELASPKQRETSQPEELLSKEEALHHRLIEVKDRPKVMARYQPPSCSCFVGSLVESFVLGTVSVWELSVFAGIVCVIFVLCAILFWNSVGTLQRA